MNWFFAVARVAGSSFPVASSLVQLQAEIDSAATQARLRRLEDPWSAIHPDVREATGIIYDAVRRTGRLPVAFSDDFYERFARVLALLEARGCIRGTHTFQKRFFTGIWLPDPYFFAYVCGLHEEAGTMDQLIARIEDAPRGQWLNGVKIGSALGLPTPVVRAIFEIYANNGLGLLSKEVGTANYQVRA
jgi:hypothetical protein